MVCTDEENVIFSILGLRGLFFGFEEVISLLLPGCIQCSFSEERWITTVPEVTSHVLGMVVKVLNLLANPADPQKLAVRYSMLTGLRVC